MRHTLVGHPARPGGRHRQADDEIAAVNRELPARAGKLEALNRELGAFGCSVAHDLRAPLRAIAGFATALEEDYADALEGDGAMYLARVTAATARTQELIDSLMRLGAVSGARLKRQRVDLSTLTRTLIAEIDEPHAERPVEWNPLKRPTASRLRGTFHRRAPAGQRGAAATAPLRHGRLSLREEATHGRRQGDKGIRLMSAQR